MSPETPAVVNLFNHIAPAYDKLNCMISWGRDQSWRRDLARHLKLKPHQVVLDISAGTGDMEPALRGTCPDLTIIGLDPSRLMLNQYRIKISTGIIVQGVAEFLNLKDESIDCITCCFGLRNFADRPRAYHEINRVLRPGGLWGFLEMSAPQGILFAKIYSLYFKRLVPFLGARFSKNPYAYQYLSDSVYQFPGYNAMVVEHLPANLIAIYYRPIFKGAVMLCVFQKGPEDAQPEVPTGG